MKKTGKIIAVAAVCACIVGVSGCASSVNRLSVDSYWYIDNYEGIQSTSIDPEENGRTAEVLLYNITFDEQSGGNGSYRVNYFTDGEDFELLFTVPPDDIRFLPDFLHAFPEIPCTPVGIVGERLAGGRVTYGSGDGGTLLPHGGFDHFVTALAGHA